MKGSKRPPPNRLAFPLRADTFQFKFTNRDKGVSYMNLDFRPTNPNGVITPRTKLSKQLSDTVCAIIGETYSFINNYADNGKGMIKYEGKTKPEARDEAKEKDFGMKFQNLFKGLSEQLKEAMELVMTAYVTHEAGSTLEIVRQRIKEHIYTLCDRPGRVLPTDSNLLARGQYVRFTKQSLLRSIYFKSETLYYCTSQFLSVMREFTPTDSSQCFHLLCMANLFALAVSEISDSVVSFFSLLAQEANILQATLPKNKRQNKTNPDNSIWKEKEESNTLNREDVYRPGTLNALIIRMTDKDKAVNSDFMLAFLAGYDLFSDSKEVWNKVEERYFVPKPSDPKQSQFIKMRVANFVWQWLKYDMHTIEPSVLLGIDKFALKTLRKDKFHELEVLIRNELELPYRFAPFVEKERAALNGSQLSDPPICIPLIGLTNLQPYEIFLFDDNRGIADQITIMEFDIYSRILRSELIGQRWSRDKYQILARNVTSLVLRSDRLSHFVASSILFQKRLKDRVKVLTRIIRVAQALTEQHNFNGLMGVLMGLTLSSISRLRHTWSKVPAKYEIIYKSLALYQDPSHSFKYYREALKVAGNPCVPYLCVYLSDLTFMDEGNPDFIVVDEKLINFPKHHLVHRTIKTMQQYQNSKYDLEIKEPLYTYLYQMPGLEEKELYSLSLEREPRDITLRDLELKDKREEGK